MNPHPLVILMADDDPDDVDLYGHMLRQQEGVQCVQSVEDGTALLAYLRREGEYSDAKRYPWPDLVLLDLNMPKLDGRQALQQLKADLALKVLPVVVLTTSNAEPDVALCYERGANGYLVKPTNFKATQTCLQHLVGYWLQVVRPPKRL